MKTNVILVVMICCLPLICLGETIHVPGDYPTIQEGIDAAVDGDTVLIADGLYLITDEPLNTRGKAIHMVSENGPENTIIRYDAVQYRRVLEINSGEDENTVIEGITFRSRIAPSDTATSGGIAICDASPVFRNCIIKENHWFYNSDYGGGVQCVRSSARFEFCEFRNNRARNGGGLSAADTSTITLLDCLFQGNTTRLDSIAYGGGVNARDNSTIIMTNCEFRKNTAGRGGAAACSYRGTLVMTDTLFAENTALDYGGAVYFDFGGTGSIGGNTGEGNRFENNRSGPGADIYYDGIPADPIPVYGNSFAGIPESHVFVCPTAAFDLHGSVGDTQPITTDVFVDVTGSITNDGLTPDTPFQSIHHALGQVMSTADNPVTVHIAPGVYSAETNRDVFPLTLPQYVSINGDIANPPVLDAADASYGICAHFSRDHTIENLVIQNGEDAAVEAKKCENISILQCETTESRTGISCAGTGFRIEGCRIYKNFWSGIKFSRETEGTIGGCDISYCDTAIITDYGCDILIDRCALHDNNQTCCAAGIFINSGCRVTLANSFVYNNRNFQSEPPYGYGGAIYAGSSSDVCLFNTVLMGNYCTASGAIAIDINAVVTFINCTVVYNKVGLTAGTGGICQLNDSSLVMLLNSIVWGNESAQIKGNPLIAYSVVQGGDSGNGNLTDDPLILPGPAGRFFLSSIDAGQPFDSPCINAGFRQADNICIDTIAGEICLSGMTTRTDGKPDTFGVDIGAHLDPSFEFPVADLQLNQNVFYPGNLFSLRLEITNPGPAIDNAFIYVLLELNGQIWFWPTWIPGACEVRTIPASGVYGETLLEFVWPETGDATGEGRFWSAAFASKNYGFLTSTDVVGFTFL